MEFLVLLLFLEWCLLFKLALSDMSQLICDGVVFFDKYYEKQLLFGALHEPRNLLLHE